ncbi:VOC family protein [Maricaulis sp.]|uniref:VOC family protein n=1 Tax=Maricaulis sp. TaxID=1486257 RepID=UPI0026185BAC|nr:VOC family protein [Maricaulis sp.]
MKMYIKSVMVEDQARAREFYTGTLGFVIKHDIPMGEFNWLTLVSPEEPEGVELGLEPNQHPAARQMQVALKADGIPWTAFSVDDIQSEYERLKAAGVSFTQAPVKAGEVTLAVFDDTCGNLIQMIEF